jgi:hypothetical protein
MHTNLRLGIVFKFIKKYILGIINSMLRWLQDTPKVIADARKRTELWEKDDMPTSTLMYNADSYAITNQLYTDLLRMRALVAKWFT